MSEVFPTVPRIVMCYFEPLSLVAGAIAPIVSPSFFIPSQLPPGHLIASQTSTSGDFTVLPTERVLAYQIANLYALLMFVGVGILNTTTEPKVVHAYVWALWLGDIGHFAGTGLVMGWEDLVRWREWNGTMWGNLGVVIVLFSVRSGYLLGWLGKDRVPANDSKRRGKAKNG